MTYVFGIYIVASVLMIGYLIWALLEMEARHRRDNEKWERRFLLLKTPDALAADDMDDEPPKEVSYMDDERMAAMERR